MDRNTFRIDVNMPSTRTSGTRRLLAEVKKKTLRSRILSALFGDQHEIVIIMPSRNVNNLTFTRADDSGNSITITPEGGAQA